MQCPLLPSPLSCLVRRESCNQTDEALRSSSCYKNSVVSLELVSLRKRKDKASVKVHGSLLYKFTSLCAQLQRQLALPRMNFFPRVLNGTQTWDHVSHPALHIFIHVGHCFMDELLL